MAATIEELKRLLINEKVGRLMGRIPDGNCPTAYYPGIQYVTGCDISDDSDDYKNNCTKCKNRFHKALYEYVEKEVMAL
jgi:hypothetical protein